LNHIFRNTRPGENIFSDIDECRERLDIILTRLFCCIAKYNNNRHKKRAYLLRETREMHKSKVKNVMYDA